MKIAFGKNSRGVHLVGCTGEVTLCGEIMEGFGYQSDDVAELVIMQPITCRRCLDIISLCRAAVE